MKKILSLLSVILMLTGVVGTAHAVSSYLTAFNTKYGTSSTVLNTCGLCHINPSGGGTRNAYGTAFSGVSTHSSNPSGAFTTIEPLDSDGDGYTNIVEINARTFPGDATSHPSTVTACTSYTYTLGACQSNNTAPVTSYTGVPSGCSGGATPATTQPCTYTPPACTSYTYTLGACQSNNTAPVTSYSGVPSGCSGGATPATTQPCTYAPPACTSYTYTLGACQSNNTAPVTTYSGIPAGCSGGLSPATVQPCTYTPPPVNGSLMPPATSGLYWDDVNKRMGIGATAPLSSLHLVENSTSGARGFISAQHNDGPQAGVIVLRKSRGTSTSPTALVQGDYIGTVHAQGYDGTSYLSNTSTASMSFFVDGPVTTGSIPTAISFQTGTTPANKAEALRITSSGNVGIGTSTPTLDLEVNGGVRLNTATSQPVCDINARGTFWVVQGVTGDTVQVCILSGGSYVWRTIAN